jgi:hypothetical protein
LRSRSSWPVPIGTRDRSESKKDLPPGAFLGEPVRLANVGQREALRDRKDEGPVRHGAYHRRESVGVRARPDVTNLEPALFRAGGLSDHRTYSATAANALEKPLGRRAADRVGDSVER